MCRLLIHARLTKTQTPCWADLELKTLKNVFCFSLQTAKMKNTYFFCCRQKGMISVCDKDYIYKFRSFRMKQKKCIVWSKTHSFNSGSYQDVLIVLPDALSWTSNDNQNFRGKIINNLFL